MAEVDFCQQAGYRHVTMRTSPQSGEQWKRVRKDHSNKTKHSHYFKVGYGMHGNEVFEREEVMGTAL